MSAPTPGPVIQPIAPQAVVVGLCKLLEAGRARFDIEDEAMKAVTPDNLMEAAARAEHWLDRVRMTASNLLHRPDDDTPDALRVARGVLLDDIVDDLVPAFLALLLLACRAAVADNLGREFPANVETWINEKGAPDG